MRMTKAKTMHQDIRFNPQDNILITTDMEEKLKHLEFIQGVINRMNSNSFAIKTWAMTILAAFLALYATNQQAWYLLVAIVPTIIFWFLDAKYLKMEKQYRQLFEDALMDKAKLFDMDASNYPINFWMVFVRPTIMWIYLPIIVLLFVWWLFASGLICTL